MLYLMIDTPTPWEPPAVLKAFIRQMEASAYRDHPQAKEAIAEVQGYLRDQLKAASLNRKQASTKARLTCK